MKTGTVLGMLGGFAAGAIAGVFYAPEKGSETRKQVLKKGEEYVDGVKTKFEEISNTVAEKFDSTKKGAEDLATTGMDKLDEVRKEVKNTASEVKSEFKK
jgi:gas vesicle protein